MKVSVLARPLHGMISSRSRARISLLIHHLALTKDKLGEELRSFDILRVSYDEWGRECVSDGRIVYLELALEWIEKLRGAESDEKRRFLIQEWKKPVEEETAQPKVKRKSRIKKGSTRGF